IRPSSVVMRTASPRRWNSIDPRSSATSTSEETTMGDYVWFHDVSWHATYAIYFFVIGICAGLSFLSYGSWLTEELRPLRAKAAVLSFALLGVGGLLLIADLSQ